MTGMAPVAVNARGAGASTTAASSAAMIMVVTVVGDRVGDVMAPTAPESSLEMIGIEPVVSVTASGSSIAMMETDVTSGGRRRPRRTTKMVARARGNATALGAATQ